MSDAARADHYDYAEDAQAGRLRSQKEPINLAGQGVFTIVNGRRAAVDAITPEGGALKDPDGTPVKGHGWNGGYVVTLMHDKQPSENQTNRPAGPGRG